MEWSDSEVVRYWVKAFQGIENRSSESSRCRVESNGSVNMKTYQNGEKESEDCGYLSRDILDKILHFIYGSLAALVLFLIVSEMPVKT